MNDFSWKSEKIMLKMSFSRHKSHFSEWSNLEVQKDFSEKCDLWSKNDILSIIFSDFQLKSFVDPKPVELGLSYIPVKFSIILPCLIAKIKLEKSVQVEKL